MTKIRGETMLGKGLVPTGMYETGSGSRPDGGTWRTLLVNHSFHCELMSQGWVLVRLSTFASFVGKCVDWIEVAGREGQN